MGFKNVKHGFVCKNTLVNCNIFVNMTSRSIYYFQMFILFQFLFHFFWWLVEEFLNFSEHSFNAFFFFILFTLVSVCLHGINREYRGLCWSFSFMISSNIQIRFFPSLLFAIILSCTSGFIIVVSLILLLMMA